MIIIFNYIILIGNLRIPIPRCHFHTRHKKLLSASLAAFQIGKILPCKNLVNHSRSFPYVKMCYITMILHQYLQGVLQQFTQHKNKRGKGEMVFLD